MTNATLSRMQEQIAQLEARRRELDQQVAVAKARLKEQERKYRTRILIQLGALFEIAGLTDTDKAILLGGLLELKRYIAEGNAAELKAKGDALFREREELRRNK